MREYSLGKKILNKLCHDEAIEVEEASLLMDPAVIALEDLIHCADQITKRNFRNKITLCAIYPAKVGLCSGDCAFCAQSVYHNCEIISVQVADLDEDIILENAKELWKQGIRHYSLVTSGETLLEREFARILHMFVKLKEETNMGLCALLGILTAERAKRLREAGLSRYHHNIETSSSFFGEICSTHSYEDKMETINIAKKAGLELCCGGIIGMGEDASQRVEMAFAIRDIGPDSVPINILHPIPGTRLQQQKPLLGEEILRTISVFRIILPDTVLKLAGGRERAMEGKEQLGYKAGINSLLAGNYLTTKGKNSEKKFRFRI